MKALLINQYFPPDTSATALVFSDLSRAMVERGHDVTVIRGRPSYQPQHRFGWAMHRTEERGGMTIHTLGSLAFNRNRFIGRLFNYLTFLALLRVVARKHRDVHDVVVVGTDPPLAPGAAVRVAGRSPVVVSLQDLHPEAAIGGGWIGDGFVSRSWDQRNMKALSRATRIVCIGRDMASRVVGKGLDPGKVVVAPNGGRSPDGDSDPAVVDELRRGSSFVAMYAGNLGSSGAWDSLLEAQDLLPSGVDIRFVGEGAEAERIKRAGATVFDLRPASDIVSVMEAGDLQIVTLKKGVAGASVPSKLYTILGYGRPVLAVVPTESEVAAVVEELGCGYVVDPQDPSAIASTISLAARSPEELARMSHAAARGATEFDRIKCMEVVTDIVEGAATASRSI